MSDKKRIKNGQRVEWTTNLGNRHAGEVVAFIPAGQHVSYYVERLEGRVFCKWPRTQDVSPLGRYLVRNEDATLASHDAPLTDRRVICRAPNATTVEKQNPTAERDPS